MEKKINIEKLLMEVFPERESGYAYEDINNVTKAYIEKSIKEACRQILVLATENAKVTGGGFYGRSGKVNKESIMETLKQLE